MNCMNRVEYEVTRECNEALNILETQCKNKSLIQTEDILLAIISAQDTGAGYSLGRHSITRSKVSKMLDSAIVVRDRTVIEVSEGLFSATSEHVKKIKENDLEFINEPPSDISINGIDLCVSEHVKAIFDAADEFRVQLSLDSGMDTYYLLVAIVENEECNAHHLLNKLMATYYSDYRVDLKDNFSIRYSMLNRKYDGHVKRKKQDKEIEDNRLTNKLENPNYSLLRDISTDLTERAKNGQLPNVIGRDDEIDQIVHTICRKNKNNAVLIGPGGVGKSAIVEGLANKIALGDIKPLDSMKILQFSMADLHDKYQDRVLNKFKEEISSEKDIILFIDEIHMLGDHKRMTDIFKPLMARGDFTIIGATTPNEWNRNIANDQALVRRFEKVYVEEPTIEDTIKIVSDTIHSYENYHQVTVPKEVIEAAVILSSDYLTEEYMPDSVFTLIDNACTMCKLDQQLDIDHNLDRWYIDERKKLLKEVDKLAAIKFNEAAVEEKRLELKKLEEQYNIKVNDYDKKEYPIKLSFEYLKQVIQKKVDRNIPDYVIQDQKARKQEEFNRLQTLNTQMQKQIIGQSEAVDIVSKAVIRSKTGFRDQSKPIGVFMFVGTTGVGKTETAKVLAKTMYGREDEYIRFDMSEYQAAHEVSKLIGAPPGYVGYGSSGELTKQVSNKPKSVILFDEIEKAHPKVYDILLQVFDDGRLTDSMGKVVDFTETIIILTSNIGASDIKHRKQVGFGAPELSELDYGTVTMSTQEAINDYFRPEFINRIDEIVTFKPFDEDSIYKITELELNKKFEAIEEMGFKVSYDRKLIDFIVTGFYDPVNGARPIKRGITKSVDDKLSELVIEGLLNEGDKVSFSASKSNMEVTIDSKSKGGDEDLIEQSDEEESR